MVEKIKTVGDLYHYLDTLFDEDVDSDTLFASGYLRGFISLAAVKTGDDQQLITTVLIDNISNKLADARSELNPQDNAIVQNFWITLQSHM